MSQDRRWLEDQTEVALQRLEQLRRRSTAGGASVELMTEALEELGIAVHELQVSMDELRAQNEQLTTAEGMIAAERRRYLDLYDFAPDGYLVTDNDAVIREANYMAGELLSTGPGALYGKPLPSFVPLPERQALRTLVRRLAAVGTGVATLQTTLIGYDGAAFAAALRVAAVGAKEDALGELRWTLRDISQQEQVRQALQEEVTERRRVEASLRRSEERYRHLVEHASDLVFEFDASGRVTFCNANSVQQMLGYAKTEIVGRNLIDLVPADQRKSVRGSIRQLAKQAATSAYTEFPVLAKDGRTVWLGQHATLAPIPGKDPVIQAVCRDITAQLERLQHVESSGAQWRELSAHLQQHLEAERTRIAREIHDELGAMLTVARMELATMTRASAACHDAAHDVGGVMQRLDHALEATRRICSDLRPSLLDNMGLVAAIEWMANDIQQRTGIRCRANLEGTSEEPDPDRTTALYRIVQEAVTNAIRHARASTLHIRQRMVNADIVIEVSDDGRGIEPPELAGRKSLGIAGMRERASTFGGGVSVLRRRHGTLVRVRMPLHGGSVAS